MLPAAILLENQTLFGARQKSSAKATQVTLLGPWKVLQVAVRVCVLEASAAVAWGMTMFTEIQLSVQLSSAITCVLANRLTFVTCKSRPCPTFDESRALGRGFLPPSVVHRCQLKELLVLQ